MPMALWLHMALKRNLVARLQKSWINQAVLHWRFLPCALLLIPVWILAAISPAFDWTIFQHQRPTHIAVALMALSGAGLAAIFWQRDRFFGRPDGGVARNSWHSLESRTPGPRAFFTLLLVGAVLRLPFFAGPPIWEDDHYRYLWDGGQVANGFNPYSNAPLSVRVTIAREAGEEIPILDADRSVPVALARLGRESGEVVPRVNHPKLTSIYPPVAQAAFAISHWLGPWNFTLWRALLFGVEVLTLFLLLGFLRKAGLPAFWAALYWWNPLAAKEFANSAHLDALMGPFLVLALRFLAFGAPFRASAAIIGAAGVKLWPVLLLGLGLRAGKRLFAPHNFLIAAAALAAFGLLLAPLVLSPATDTRGFFAYVSSWDRNSLLTPMLTGAVELGARMLDPLYSLDPRFWARMILAGLAGVFAVIIALRPFATPSDAALRLFMLAALIFSVSPAQYPWYAAAIFPLAAAAGAWRFAATAAIILPLYYSGKAFYARGQDEFQALMPLIQHPLLLLALWADWKHLRITPGAPKPEGIVQPAD